MKPNPPGRSQDAHVNSPSAIHSQADSHSKAAQVLSVFKGVITNITNQSTAVSGPTFNTSGGATPSTITLADYTCADGAVTITVKRVNQKRVFKALTDNNDPLTLNLRHNSDTKIIVKGKGKGKGKRKVALADVTAGAYNNYGMVKVRYALKSFDPATAADLQGFLSTAATQVIVKKALPTS